jgi:hypothetical protein
MSDTRRAMAIEPNLEMSLLTEKSLCGQAGCRATGGVSQIPDSRISFTSDGPE